MNGKEKNIKCLLIQIREDEETLREEFDEFVRFSGIPAENWKVINLFETGRFSKEVLEGVDVLWYGGSSHEDKLNKYHKEAVFDAGEILRYATDKKLPVFASCYGFELAVEAFGGHLTVDTRNTQELNVDIKLTPEGERDVLFEGFPKEFEGISWHKYRADEKRLPKGMSVLASAETCPVEIFKMENSKTYGFQFHPELDAPDVKARLTRYIDIYPEQKDALQQILDALHDAPKANELLRLFVERIVQ